MSAIDAQVGHPDLRNFLSALRAANDDREVQRIVKEAVGPTELMEFMRFNQGEVLRHDPEPVFARQVGEGTSNIVRLLIGNPLIMRQMAKHVPDAGSYAPVTILVDERPDGVHISYDRMTSLLRPYENAAALEIARTLDTKIETLITTAAK